MQTTFTIDQIGTAHADDENGFYIQLYDEYRSALLGLDGFSHATILWWFSKCDDEASRRTRIEEKPYKKGPAKLGVFATRSPLRPNPIAVSVAQITFIDIEQGILGLTYFDAIPDTPILDIKPYTPSVDRVEQPSVPDWCRHWPSSAEQSGDFDWENEFNF